MPDIMVDLLGFLKPGGILIGMTPNFSSLNISLSGKGDPVVAPPSHTIYFTKQTLDNFLVKLGLSAKLNITKGVSTNSFLRSEKFSPSFVEVPETTFQKIISKPVRLLFSILGLLVMPFNKGYHVYFVYKKI